MNPKQPAPPAPLITMREIYYILFRHKWLIAILSVVAIAATLLVRFAWPWPYVSEARLLIKYVKETRPPTESGNDSTVSTPDHYGDTIISSEIAILTSMDLAEQVADIIGPAKILGKSGGSNRVQAATIIEKGLIIPMSDVGRKSDVIDVVFTHKDPEVTSNVLAQLIDSYEVKHKDVHRPEFNDYVTQEIDRIKAAEQQTDSQLRETKSNANIISLEDSKKMYSDRMAALQARLDDAVAEDAGHQETIRQLKKLVNFAGTAAGSTNAGAATNLTATIPPEKAMEYQRLKAQWESQKADEEKLLGIFTTNYPDVRIKEAQIAQTEALKAALETKYPGLANLRKSEGSVVSSGGKAGADPADLLSDETIKADALEARIQALTNELARVQSMGATIIATEARLQLLEKEKAGEDTNLAFYSQRLEEYHSNEALQGNSNLAVVETPTPPARDLKKILKATLGTLLAGLIFAFGLPFFIELVWDRSLKHPMDVQSKLGLPFFISIPQMNGNGRATALAAGKKPALLTAKTEGGTEQVPGTPEPVSPTNGHLALWDESHSLQPFYETLRDRLMTFFEMINLTHKPKLVAVTSCSEGAGVTSTAAGLASSLSETGDGNVLLVNMNVSDGEAHHFYKGKLTCGLDEVLEKKTRDHAYNQGNLYVAKEQPEDDRLPRVLPKRFNHLLPKMKASDFDYIIFDMPPVSQISITPRLARFMDMVLLVVESGKTDRDAAKRAADLLSESKTNVGVVLNKNRAYVPRRLHHDI